MNRVVLSAQLVQRGVMRYTPAGIPALDLVLRHESELSENGQLRKVSFEIRALALGDVTQPLAAMSLGDAALLGGFLAAGRNGRSVQFHITTFERAA